MECPKCGFCDEIGTRPIKMGATGLLLVKQFEGLYLKSYLCPARKWTIGYGHTGSVDGVPICNGTKITQSKADILLAEDMEKYAKPVRDGVSIPLQQKQFDALVSFTFNVGIAGFKSSTLLKILNSGQMTNELIVAQFLRWNKATIKGKKVIVAGLTRRRKSEAHLFVTGELKTQF